jgi:hypothetical protein
LKKVAIFTHKAAQRSVESIIAINSVLSLLIIFQSIIPHFIVLTTSQPAIKAHAASKIIAKTIAQPRLIAFDQTAGHILLATSFAQRLIAIYIANTTAISK